MEDILCTLFYTCVILERIAGVAQLVERSPEER